jgi:hypothetical protein
MIMKSNAICIAGNADRTGLVVGEIMLPSKIALLPKKSQNPFQMDYRASSRADSPNLQVPVRSV